MSNTEDRVRFGYCKADFEMFLLGSSERVFYNNDCWNCPFRAFLRDKGINAGVVDRLGWTPDTPNGYALPGKRPIPLWASEFIVALDNFYAPDMKASQVSNQDCLRILERI